MWYLFTNAAQLFQSPTQAGAQQSCVASHLNLLIELGFFKVRILNLIEVTLRYPICFSEVRSVDPVALKNKKG